MRAEGRQGWLFLAPWLVGFVMLSLLPAGASLILAMTSDVGAGALGDRPWIGARAFSQAVSVDASYRPAPDDPRHWHWLGGRPRDPLVYRSLLNSVTLTAFQVPVTLVVSLAMARLLHGVRVFPALARACVYLPHLMGGAATLLIWAWLLNPRFGAVNQVIRSLYTMLDPVVSWWRAEGTSDWPVPEWLQSPAWSLPAVVLIQAWTSGGLVLVFLAGLRRIPRGMLDAATMDGAAWWSRFHHVTLPMISPIVFFAAVVSTVFTMQTFTEGYFLGNRSQDDALLFAGLYVYQLAFEPPSRLGYASVCGWLLFGLIVCMLVPLVIVGRRWVFEAWKS